MLSALQTQRQKKDFSNTNISKNLYDNFAREDNNNFLFKIRFGRPDFFIQLYLKILFSYFYYLSFLYIVHNFSQTYFSFTFAINFIVPLSLKLLTPIAFLVYSPSFFSINKQTKNNQHKMKALIESVF